MTKREIAILIDTDRMDAVELALKMGYDRRSLEIEIVRGEEERRSSQTARLPSLDELEGGSPVTSAGYLWR